MAVGGTAGVAVSTKFVGELVGLSKGSGVSVIAVEGGRDAVARTGKPAS